MGEAEIERWFAEQGWQPFAFQREVWRDYLHRKSGLIHSPTGTGKTYAAWLGPLIEWLDETPDQTTAPLLRVLWITPLRALASDTATSLRAPLEYLNIPWTVETRTSDTSSSVRNRQRERLPSALITTPESLSLLLTRTNAQQLFADLRLVVVDEWHELMGTKRGVQIELGLARLRHWNPNLRIWGISATMGNLQTALHALIGVTDALDQSPKGRMIGGIAKPIAIDSIIPPQVERFPWAGHMGLSLLPQVLAAIEASKTTLIFTNTRSQTERWYQALLEARPDWAGEIALHHSSLELSTRTWVENSLRKGTLRCAVCTSSLDLGVDFPTVERVLQIGSPKGVARLIQRAGRSGHQPGAESRVTCVPTHALELMEVSAAREAMQQGHIEARLPIEKPFDVLVQHLVTVGLGDGFTHDALYHEVRTTWSYRNLTAEEWDWLLDFVVHGGPALKNYAQYRRVVYDGERYTVQDAEVARLHRMSIGTILGDSTLEVQYLRGGKIGTIEESFVSRLKRGDIFTLAGKTLEFVMLRDMKVWVRKSKKGRGLIPSWYGGSLPLSEQLTEFVRSRIALAHDGKYVDAEMLALRPLYELQAHWSVLPTPNQLLVETTKTREGYHLFIFPFEGRLVHEGLAVLVAYRIAQSQPITFTITVNDYGFDLLSADPVESDSETVAGWFSTKYLDVDLIQSLNAAEMARRQFREIARVAGLVISNFPGGRKTIRQLQVSTSLIYDVLAQYDPDNLLLTQARQEVMQRQLEKNRLLNALQRIESGEIIIKNVPRPTPFAFPLVVEFLRQTVSSETLEQRIRKMQMSYEQWADKETTR
jgi:ATP-dependent Lhr-like helicase